MARPAILKDRNHDCHCEEAVFADEAISSCDGGDCFAKSARNDRQVSE